MWPKYVLTKKEVKKYRPVIESVLLRSQNIELDDTAPLALLSHSVAALQMGCSLCTLVYSTLLDIIESDNENVNPRNIASEN